MRGFRVVRGLALCWLACVPAVCPPAAAIDPSTAAAVRASATEAEVRDYRQCVALLASEAMDGRRPGTKGADKARDYLADQLRAAGLKPAFAKAATQPFPVRLGMRAEKQSLQVRGTKGEVLASFAAEADFNAMGFSASRSFAGPAVFVGYAVVSKAHKYDSFAGVAKDALKGKVAVAFRYEPQDARGRSRWTTQVGQWSRAAGLAAKAVLARKYGATALLIVNPPSHREAPLHTASSTTLRLRGPIPVMQVTTDAFQRMLARAGFDAGKEIARLQALADTGREAFGPIAGLRVAGEVKLKAVHGTTDNVAAVLPGQGKLAGEAVVVGAHYDHLGRRGASGGKPGVLLPGANDNASGTAGILTLARRFAQRACQPTGAPRRTIVFACFGAEERGLIGSSHMARHLPDLGLRPSQVVAMVNMDMIGRLAKDRLSVWGVASGKGWREAVTRAAEGSGLKPAMSGGGFGPSDHASFYRIKVPVVCFSTGGFRDLHRPTDTADKIDAGGAIRVLDVVDRLVQALATEPERIAYVPPRAGGSGRRAFLGVQIDRVEVAGETGARLARIVPDGPADKAGLRDGDVITHWAGKPIADATALVRAILAAKPGDAVKLTVRRAEQVLHVTVKLAGR